MVRVVLVVVLTVLAVAGAAHAQSVAPADRPVLADRTEQTRRLERAIAPYVTQARQTYPAAKVRYINGLPPGQRFYVTHALSDGAGRREQVFVAVRAIEAGAITGIISNNVLQLTEYRQGQTVTFPENDILDWTITHADGTEEGNVVGNFLDTYKP